MTNLRNEVWKLIDRDPSIKLDLERGLVNMRALARYCADKGIDGTEEALLSAIRRYPKEQKAHENYERVREVIESSSVSAKSDVASIWLNKTSEVQERLSAIYTIVKYEKGEICRIIQAEESIHVIIDSKNLKKIENLFPQNAILAVYKNLGEINIKLNRKTFETYGVLAVIADELARNKINIHEILSCSPEILIHVEQKSILKAYQALFELCHA